MFNVLVDVSVIFGLYADETYSYVEKQRMDALVLATEGCVSDTLSLLFMNVRLTFTTLLPLVIIGNIFVAFAS